MKEINDYPILIKGYQDDSNNAWEVPVDNKAELPAALDRIGKHASKMDPLDVTDITVYTSDNWALFDVSIPQTVLSGEETFTKELLLTQWMKDRQGYIAYKLKNAAQLLECDPYDGDMKRKLDGALEDVSEIKDELEDYMRIYDTINRF